MPKESEQHYPSSFTTENIGVDISKLSEAERKAHFRSMNGQYGIFGKHTVNRDIAFQHLKMPSNQFDRDVQSLRRQWE